MRMVLHLTDGQAVDFLLNRQPVQLYRLLHDYEMGEARPDARPEMCRFQEHHYSPLTFEWQWKWYAENGGRETDPTGQRWSGYTGSDDFITNDKGTDLFRDWINSQRLDRPDPMIQTLGCGGNVITGVETTFKGIRQLAVKTFNGNQPPPDGFGHVMYPYLWHWATIATLTTLPDGSRKVNRFTHLGERGVLFPLLSRFQVYYPMERLKKLPQGSPMPGAYNP